MINKLRKKISLIILSAIAIPLLIGIILYDFSYYENIVRTNADFVDRFFEGPKDKEVQIKNDSEKSKMIDIDGVYSVEINNKKIITTSDNVDENIKEYALKTSKDNKLSGIVGNYIYKKRSRGVNDSYTTIILIESHKEINKIKIVFAISFVLSIVGVILIYILSKKIATLIVKPVEETFNKQIEFISDASHELKTPLAVIQANADVLEGEIGKNKWLSYIQNETENMGKLIQELLLLTKIENVDMLREKEKFNISNHIELIVSSFESMAYEKNVEIESNIEKDIVTEIFNKDDITHILSTLIDNAIKHTEEKRKVIVELKKQKEKIMINVKNQGKEIPVSEREKIFDRFYRIDKSRNRNEKRYGLGLSIAKAIVIKNQGTIQVDYIDGFTIFNVELPL